MNTIIILLSLLLSVLPADTTSTKKMQPVITDDTNRAFSPDECLTVTAEYHCIGIHCDVGTATLSVRDNGTIDGRPVYTVDASARTATFFDRFFKVRDFYHTRFLADNGRPLEFQRNIYEGGYALTNDFVWDTDNDNIHVHCRYISSGRRTDTVLTGDRSTYDILSVIYAARNIDYDRLAVGTAFPFTFVIDEEKYDIYFRYEGKDEKRIPGLGTFRTVRIAARVVEGEVFKEDSEVILHISDDRNHLPLWIESPIIVGSVVGRLTGYENIRHPLDSRIK